MHTTYAAELSDWAQAVSSVLAVVIAGITTYLMVRQHRRAEQRADADRRRAEAERHRTEQERAQARHVSAWWGNGVVSGGDLAPGVWGAIAANDSAESVQYAHLTVTHVQDRWVSKYGWGRIGPHSSIKWAAPRVYANAEGRTGPVPADATDPDGSCADPTLHQVEMTFVDRDGEFWLYDRRGQLRRLSRELVLWADDERLPTCRTLFERTFAPRYGVDVSFHGFARTEDLQRRFHALAAGPDPAPESPDIMVGPHDWLGRTVACGAVEEVPLTEAQRASFHPRAVQAFTCAGRLYGIPYAFDCVALLRNLDLTGDGAPPADFGELIADGERIAGARGLAAPLAVQVGPAGDPYHLWPVFSSAGGTLLGLRDDGGFDPPHTWRAGLDTAFAALAELGETGRGVLRRDIDRDRAHALFCTGQTPYLITAAGALGRVEGCGARVAVSPVPAYGPHPSRSLLTVLGFYARRDSRNERVVQDLVTYHLARARTGVQLNRIQAWPPVQAAATEEVLAMHPLLAGYVAAAERALLMPSHPAMRQVWDVLAAAQVDVIAGTLEPAAGAARFVAEAGRLLADDAPAGPPGPAPAAPGVSRP
ncbi:MAG TPA: extracellular solute-binding protein [Pilimelia sp.]|nr:extracellular solute-binding protein [Pilimelia sp.]